MRYLFFLLVAFVLAGCDGKGGKESKELNEGFVNFATILVMDDLITHASNSVFASLSPVAMIDPDVTTRAEQVLQGFRYHFEESREVFPARFMEGMVLAWTMDHHGDAEYGISFHQDDHSNNLVFAGKISAGFDPVFYNTTPYPIYAKGTDVAVVCREFVSAAERKNSYLHWVEVSLDKCMAASDYYATQLGQLKMQQERLKERLYGIYEGKEEVSEEIALKLTTFYLAGDAFADDSPCLYGEREECLANLREEILQKYAYGDTDAAGVLRIRQVKSDLKVKAPLPDMPGENAVGVVSVEKDGGFSGQDAGMDAMFMPPAKEVFPGEETE